MDPKVLINEIRKSIKEEVKNEFGAGLGPVRRDLLVLKVRMNDLGKQNTLIQKALASVSNKSDRALKMAKETKKLAVSTYEEVKKLSTKVDDHFNFLDRDFSPKIKRIEDHLGLSQQN